MTKWVPGVALCAVLVSTGCFMPAAAANREREANHRARLQQVQQQFGIMAGSMEQAGYRLSEGPRTGYLDREWNTADDIRYTFRAGQSYVIRAVCDAGCSDVDLHLYDPSNRLVMEDVAADDLPAVGVQSAVSGAYRVRVTIPSCRYDRCMYGVALYTP